MGIATIIALLVGPILAVWVTRRNDDRRLKQTRRMDVFRTLMRTRRVRLNPDHVGALNLVEIEFHGEASVIEAWKAYWNHLRMVAPAGMNQDQERQFYSGARRFTHETSPCDREDARFSYRAVGHTGRWICPAGLAGG
jgi:hypothetical protein